MKQSERSIFYGGGEMGERMRAFPWADSALGPATHWPASLKALVDITLAAKQHDQKWLIQFMQKPASVSPDTACHTKLSEKDANDVYRYLKKLLKAPPPAAGRRRRARARSPRPRSSPGPSRSP